MNTTTSRLRLESPRSARGPGRRTEHHDAGRAEQGGATDKSAPIKRQVCRTLRAVVTASVAFAFAFRL
jgi:hypothetical protein